MRSLAIFLAVVMFALIGVSAVFATGEAIHHAGLNPFEEPPAAVAAHSPALTTDRAGMGAE